MYGLDGPQTEERFCVGRIFGLRGRIVRGGEMCPIHGALLDLLEGVYVDVLLDRLDLPSRRKAEEVLTTKAMTARAMVEHSRR